jgi:hypothetical protein
MQRDKESQIQATNEGVIMNYFFPIKDQAVNTSLQNHQMNLK